MAKEMNKIVKLWFDPATGYTLSVFHIPPGALPKSVKDRHLKPNEPVLVELTYHLKDRPESRPESPTQRMGQA